MSGNTVILSLKPVLEIFISRIWLYAYICKQPQGRDVVLSQGRSSNDKLDQPEDGSSDALNKKKQKKVRGAAVDTGRSSGALIHIVCIA